MNKRQLTPKLKVGFKILPNDFQFDSFNFQLIFHIIEEVILSSLMKIIELHKVSNLKYFQTEFKSFQTPFHFFEWKKSYHLHSRVLYLKRIWIHGEQKAKMKVWESPFIPSHLTSKSFKFHSINHPTIKQSIKSIYLI